VADRQRDTYDLPIVRSFYTLLVYEGVSKSFWTGRLEQEL
jgi:hypothetical protein